MSRVTPTRMDRMIASVSPGWAAKRLRARNRFEIMAGGYDAAIDQRYRDGQAWRRSLPLDEDTLIGNRDRQSVRLELHDLRRNLGLVFGMLNRFADGVVGTGLTPVPTTSDPEWNAQAADFWQNYMKVADARQRLSGWEIMRLGVKARLVDGEFGLVKTDGGQVQPIEAERIVTPQKQHRNEGKSVVEGFRISPKGIPVGVFISPRNAGAVDDTKTQFVPMRNFIHAAIVERFDQIRGVPGAASIVNYLRDKGEFTAATLFKAKLDAFQAWSISSSADMIADNLLDRTATQPETPSGVREEKHDMGTFYYGPEGTEVKSLKSETPNSQYDAFTQNLLTEIAMSVGIPYQVLMLDLAKVSFSGGRGILMQAYATYGIWRTWLVNESIQPWWNWRVAKAIIDGVLPPAPIDSRGISEWYKVEWTPPPLDWIDPKGEATANAAEVTMGTKSISGIARSRGTSAKAVFAQKAEDIKAAMDQADLINEERPEAGVTWRDITNPGGKPGPQPAPRPSPAEREEEDEEEDESA